MSSKNPETGATRLGPTPTVQSDYVRIARSLIGATPEGLAALFDLSSDTPTTRLPISPIPQESELSSAIRLVMSCYQDTSAAEPQPVSTGEEAVPGTETIMRHYIALRSAWESREARSIAAWMTERGPADAGDVAATTTPAQIEQAPVAPAIRQRVLVVDDSPDILVIASAFLNDFGFDVIHAASADAALLMLAEGEPVDLLVTDYAMPGMNGIDLVVQARERNLQQRALVITGYADSSALRDLPDGVAVLAKPFRRAELYECILSIIGTSVRAEDVATMTHESAHATRATVT